MRVAAVQLSPRDGVAASLAHHVALLREAAEQGARLVVLPEGGLCGFARSHAAAMLAAQPLDGPYVTALCELTDELGIAVVAHLYERVLLEGRDAAHNTTVVVDHGERVGAYRKIHLFDAQGFCESAVVEPGDPGQLAGPVVVVEGVGVGLATCFDLRFAEQAVTLARHGATMLAVGAAWVAGAGKRDQFDVLVRARAIETGCYVAAAAQPGPRFCGGTTVCDPLGVPVAVPLDEDGEGIVVADVDPTAVGTARAATPTLRHRPTWGAR